MDKQSTASVKQCAWIWERPNTYLALVRKRTDGKPTRNPVVCFPPVPSVCPSGPNTISSGTKR